MSSSSPDFQIFTKPAGPACNLNCRYCYYLSRKSLFPESNQFLMTDEILEMYILKHIQATFDDLISFSWHGGEPLLAGIDFFRRVLFYQARYKPVRSIILNGIQTNGTLLNEEWCSFLAREKFTVGISIDGPEDLHNENRRTRSGGKTLPDVIKGYELLRKHGIIPEILCVINSGNVKHPLMVYDYLKKLEPQYISFLPLVIRDDESDTGVSMNSVPSMQYGIFMSSIFDQWIVNDIGRLKIQIIEEAARTAFNQDHTLCIFKEKCGRVPVLEHTGDFYSCDHYVDENHHIGNIRDYSLTELLENEKQKSFGEAKSLTLPQFCLNCEVKEMCNGECPRNRFILSPDGEPGLNYLCSGYKEFFNHCKPFVEAISKIVTDPLSGQSE